ncbi:MAG: ThuA domain-containing protein [Sedimentisphaerales bacterium]
MPKSESIFRAGNPALLLTAVMTGVILWQGITIAKNPPLPRDRAEVEAVLSKAVSPKGLPDMNIVLLADVKDHGENEHDYPLWQKRWALLLGGRNAGDNKETQVNLFGPALGDYNEITGGGPYAKVETAWEWPSEEQFQTADVIVAFCYLKWNEQRIKQVESYLSSGKGLVVVHPASWTKPEPSPEVAKLIGISGYKLYRHGIVDLKITAPEHPICLGLPEKIRFDDEVYWPAGIQTEIEVLGTSDERGGGDSNDLKPQTIFWTHSFGKGRVFGCLPGHNNWTFDDPYFRILLLRGIAWAGGQSPYRFDGLVLRGAALKK